MDSKYAFSPMEIDAIGEILNISLGASATAVSTMLNTRVDITTPKVKVAAAEEFTFRNLQPAIGVEITYVDGLDGKNIMLLKRSDIKIIVELLMGMEIPDDEFELDEMNVSAVCEVMNQMMGASSTALSEFLGKTVNISTPISFEIESEDEFKQKYFITGETMIIVDFLLRIEGKLESEFLNVMTPELAKELLSGFLPDDYVDSAMEEQAQPPTSDAGGSQPLTQAQIDQMASGGGGSQPLTQAQIDQLASGGGGSQPLTQAQIDQLASGGGGSQPLTQAQIDQMASGGGGSQPLTQAQIDQLASGGGGSQPLTQAQIDQMASGGGGSQPLTQAQIDQMASGGFAGQPAAQPQMAAPMGMPGMAAGQIPMQPQMAAPMYGPDPMMLQQMSQQQLLIQQMMEQMTRMQSELAESKRNENKMMSARPLNYDGLSGSKDLGQEQQENLDLIMGVTMDVSVEIGRTRSYVKDILEYTKGTLVVLDKQAGDPVDLYVNGQCIAKGEVVVVDDNFGIRISEVLKTPDNE